MRDVRLWFILLTLFPALSLMAGQQQPEQKKPAIVSPAARLESAKTALIIRTRGSDVPYDVISHTIEGWGRFTLVDTPEKADIVVEVSSEGGDSGVSVSSSSGISPGTGRMEQSTKSSKSVSATEITLRVLDAKNKRVLWTGTEKVKSAFKEAARENNTVEASQKLASKLHDRLEPPPKP